MPLHSLFPLEHNLKPTYFYYPVAELLHLTTMSTPTKTKPDEVEAALPPERTASTYDDEEQPGSPAPAPDKPDPTVQPSENPDNEANDDPPMAPPERAEENDSDTQATGDVWEPPRFKDHMKAKYDPDPEHAVDIFIDPSDPDDPRAYVVYKRDPNKTPYTLGHMMTSVPPAWKHSSRRDARTAVNALLKGTCSDEDVQHKFDDAFDHKVAAAVPTVPDSKPAAKPTAKSSNKTSHSKRVLPTAPSSESSESEESYTCLLYTSPSPRDS